MTRPDKDTRRHERILFWLIVFIILFLLVTSFLHHPSK